MAESGLASWPWLPVGCAPPVAVRWRGDGGCGLHRGLSNFGVFSLSCNSKLLLSVSVLFMFPQLVGQYLGDIGTFYSFILNVLPVFGQRKP